MFKTYWYKINASFQVSGCLNPLCVNMLIKYFLCKWSFFDNRENN